MNTAVALNCDFDPATRRYNPTSPPQSAEEHARRMLERARQGLQVNQRRYEKATRRGRWDVVAESLGGIERAEQAIRRWQQELDRIRSSRGPYRFDDERDTLLDEATYLERGIHGYFPFSRGVYSRCRCRGLSSRRPMSRYGDDDLDAMIDEALRSRSGGGGGGSGGGRNGYQGSRLWCNLMDQAIAAINQARRNLDQLRPGMVLQGPELQRYRSALLLARRLIMQVRGALPENFRGRGRVVRHLNRAIHSTNQALSQNPVQRGPNPRRPQQRVVFNLPDVYLESALNEIREAQRLVCLRVFSRNDFDHEIDALLTGDDLDAMIDEALQLLPGGGGPGSGGPRPLSPWLDLLNQTVQALERAIGYLNSPDAPGSLDNTLNQIEMAEANLNLAGQEIQKVISGDRQTRVMDRLSNAAIRIQAASAAVVGESAFVPGGRSLIDPRTSLQGAISHIQAARNAVGLQLV